MSTALLWLLMVLPAASGAALTVGGVHRSTGFDRAAAPAAIGVSAATVVLAVTAAVVAKLVM